MNGWSNVLISDVVDFNPDNVGRNYPHSEIFYLDISSVGSGFADYGEPISLKDAPSRAKRIVGVGDTIVATVRPGNRSFYFFKELPGNTIVSTGFAVLRPINRFIDSRFLYHLISDPKFTAFLVANEQGANYPAVTSEVIGRYETYLPPISTQRKIASILSAYDDLIENNLRRIKLLEEVARRTYEEWFVKLKVKSEKLKVDKRTGLPEGWERRKLVEVANLTMGQSPKSEYYNKEGNGLPFHQGVSDYGFRFPENAIWSTQGNRFAFKGDILFSVRAPVGRINMAKEKIILGRGLAAINHRQGYTSFLFYQLQSMFFEEDMMGGGAIFNSVTKNDIERIELVCPSPDFLREFNRISAQIDEQIENLTYQNARLKESRDLLLPRLMSGVMEVKKQTNNW